MCSRCVGAHMCKGMWSQRTTSGTITLHVLSIRVYCCCCCCCCGCICLYCVYLCVCVEGTHARLLCEIRGLHEGAHSVYHESEALVSGHQAWLQDLLCMHWASHLKSKITFFIYLLAYLVIIYLYMCAKACGVGPRRFKPGHQAWQQMPLTADHLPISHWVLNLIY